MDDQEMFPLSDPEIALLAAQQEVAYAQDRLEAAQETVAMYREALRPLEAGATVEEVELYFESNNEGEVK